MTTRATGRSILGVMWIRRVVVAAVGYALFAIALGAVYLVAQHDGRSAAEDGPRVVLSSAESSHPSGRFDLARYQGVFWMRFAATDRTVAGNAFLHGRPATVPVGVLETARRLGEDAVTWQPAPGLRYAIVAERAKAGEVVVAGQSLSRTEFRASQVLVGVALAHVCGFVLVSAAVVIDWRLSRAGGPL